MAWNNQSNLTVPMPRLNELVNLIREHSVVITYPAKKVFLEPGTILDGVYYIAEGRTRHYMVAIDGTEKILYTLAAGWFFGETPCFLEEPTGLYSRTDVKTTIYKIDLSSYAELLGTNQSFRDAILQSYSKKMLILRHEVENLTFNSCKDRLKRLFCSTTDSSHLIDSSWYNLKVHYTQYELGTIVGGARVTISKLLSEMCAEGFIRVLNRNIQINARKYEKYVSWFRVDHR